MVDLRMYVSWKFSCILNFITADQHLNDRKNFFHTIKLALRDKLQRIKYTILDDI